MRFNTLFPFPSRKNLLKHPFDMVTGIFIFVAVFMILLGAFLFFTIGILEGNMDDGRVVLFTIVPQIVVWAIIAVVFICIVSSGKRKLRFLKQNGRQFKAEIINLTPVIGVNVGFSTITVRAECIYLNEQQQRCKVKSNMFIWGNLDHEKLQAEVYVDWNDPYNYAIEITQREFDQHQVDIDYT